MVKKILIVDDDTEFVEATKNVLKSSGYAVDSASNGKEAITKMKAAKPDLILLDVMMDTKDEGFEVSRQIAADEALKKIPIIMITGIRKDMSLPFGFESDPDWLPVKTVLEKPVKPVKLIDEIKNLLK
jgi:two-component system, OmpR family, alkaline phosphatase synthesis response regulator PhoP